MTPERYLQGLAACLDRLSGFAAYPDAMLSRPVPTCPQWTLDGLFGHLGSVERWAAGIVRQGTLSQPPNPPAEDAAQWFAAGTADFMDAMASLDPDAPCWTFGPQPGTAGFWPRRQLHEHTIHLFDACIALGLVGPQTEENITLDGVDEVLAILAPRQVRMNRMPAPEGAVSFKVPGHPGWTFGEGQVRATVSSDASTMYLGLWGRSELAETAAIEGDRDFALNVMKGPLTP
jgi:uncharacterized protein (TIGR03083 family)